MRTVRGDRAGVLREEAIQSVNVHDQAGTDCGISLTVSHPDAVGNKPTVHSNMSIQALRVG